jgi:hypothetical protein
MQIQNRYLFNFAVSYSGGGFKRLYEYAKWFNGNGGAWFIIHPRCEDLIGEFPNNRFFLVSQPGYQRIFNDCGYLKKIETELGQPALYYSYGIPIYFRFGRINWFHLSNVLPLGSRGIPLPLFDRLKLAILGWKIRRNFQNADVISAESNFSLGLIEAEQTEKLFLSVNGSDDELTYRQNCIKQNIAVVLGTYRYKALEDSFYVYEMLRKINGELKLMIIGNEKTIPEKLRHNNSIIIAGLLRRSEVIEYLRKARYYISTTRIENSYNAASEGVFFADESYISDIGPHRELLASMPFDRVSVPNMTKPILHVNREDISGANLKSWESVITDMIAQAQVKLKELRAV